MNKLLARTVGFCCITVGLLIAACGGSQPPLARNVVSVPVNAIRPGDQIRLVVFRELEFSGEFLVDEGGTVVFPRLGEIRVIDDTPDSLEARLTEGFREYLVNPSIEMTVLRRVSITGAVPRPDIYYVDPTIAVSEALALAGGVTPLGNPNEISLIRDGQIIATFSDSEARIADLSIFSGDQLFIPEQGWFSRNITIVTALFTTAVGIAVAVLVNN